MRKYGPFHRVEATFQKKEDALKQVASGEIWGRTPKNGRCPTVQAYPARLPNGRRGIEFSTDIENERKSSPLEARWYLDANGVEERFDGAGIQYACISAEVKNFQP